MVNSAIELSAFDEEIAKIVSQNQKDIEKVFEKAISKGQADGTVSTAQTAKHLAQFFYNSITGIRVAMKYNKSKSAVDDIVKINLSLLK